MATAKDHGKISDAELLIDLKNSFKENNEATGMSFIEFYQSLLEDKQSRYLLWDHFDTF